MRRSSFLMKTLGSCLLLLPLSLYASVTLKVASTAPDNTTWAKSLKNMASEVEKKTGGRVKFRIYPGGQAGDENSVLRQIRMGKMHGGVFTGKTLGEINGDIRVLEVPFSFSKNQAQAQKVMEKGEGLFEKGFQKNQYHMLGLYELGHVYLVSKKKVSSLDDLKGQKIWAWEGDKLAEEFVKAMKLVAVPLGLESVMTSLSTGMIDTAYSPPLGILALQWHNSISYLVDFPVTFSVGALVVHDKFMKKISTSDQKIVVEVAKKHADWANKRIHKENQGSLETLKSMGIEFISLKDKDFQEGKAIRSEVIKKLKGKLFSAEALGLLPSV